MLTIKNERELAAQLELLRAKAAAHKEANASAESFYLLARITYGSTFSQSPLGVRRSMRETKDLLEQGLAIDERMLHGNPKALLGYLYVGLPGWPISFGDRDKGLVLLEEAMQIDDKDMANNYFYVGKMLREKNYQAARDQLIYARELENPDSPAPAMQALLLREINSDLADIEKQLEARQ